MFNRAYHFLLFIVLIATSPGFSEENAQNPPLEQQQFSKKRLRFFNLDLHISVIADVKNIFETFGHEVVDWSLSGATWVFGKQRDAVDIVNEKTWMDLNPEMCERFYERYKDFLNQFDGFIVTHNSSFSLLYEKFNKPIIIINSTRYENPFTRSLDRWIWLNDYLKKGVKKNKIFIISNNKGDQRYLKFYTGLDSLHIPSLCLYTNAEYTGRQEGFILHCLSGTNFHFSLFEKLYNRDLFQNHKLSFRYQWQNLYDYQGVVHFPYQVSTMSLFEQYSANVPLFVPTKRFLYELFSMYPYAILSQLSFFVVNNASPPATGGDLNNINDSRVIKAWIDSADYYDSDNMPFIQYFGSFEELEFLLQTADLKEISKKMKQHNLKRKERIMEKWKEVLTKVMNEIH
ncbi:MAG: hypothetical protein A3D18_05105 [Chlamydiae bacterium RIFCSPHIGHO2_02_FULL_49_29]|nr:MAG: hypothetical protein A3D18_05105 [Chlamydiae bacterium RIFCSPHIGHO2_02_FULL_49_29]